MARARFLKHDADFTQFEPLAERVHPIGCNCLRPAVKLDEVGIMLEETSPSHPA